MPACSSDFAALSDPTDAMPQSTATIFTFPSYASAMVSSAIRPRSQLAAALGRMPEELDEQPAHLPGSLLRHPMPGALDQMKAHHARARGLLHALGRARSLVGAPVALAA